jgi:tRNA U34 5-carboxymethylaminomethyl modifying GTPase MnmE/TrmE
MKPENSTQTESELEYETQFESENDSEFETLNEVSEIEEGDFDEDSDDESLAESEFDNEFADSDFDDEMTLDPDRSALGEAVIYRDSSIEESADPLLAEPPPTLTLAMAPRVAIIGRPNVGKSTLFNILSESRKAVVKDQPGVTRDIQIHPMDIWGKSFDLIDTGGVTESNPRAGQRIFAFC